MTPRRKSTRKRLVEAALNLFAKQGVTETTTRQIADLAEVNEVTLFRQFGSKHGLLLAVMEEAEVFTQVGLELAEKASQIQDFATALQTYAEGHLQALEEISEFVRSLVGGASHYPRENREAIGRGLTQIHDYTTQYLVMAMQREQIPARLPINKLASFLNALLLGYAVIEFTTEFHDLWEDRQEFITDLVKLFHLAEGINTAHEATPQLPAQTSGAIVPVPTTDVFDLPAPLVKAILHQARQTSPQDFALAYVLFGAGLSAEEAATLERSHSICDSQQHVLQISQGLRRQVPLNQWIMGRRYGSYTSNPLTQWLKTRKDKHLALFINSAGQPMSAMEIRLRWQLIITEIKTPFGQPPTIEQAQHTWRVEMLMRGITIEGLSLLTGCTPEQLQPYIRRAKAKAVLEQAVRLDQHPQKLETLDEVEP